VIFLERAGGGDLPGVVSLWQQSDSHEWRRRLGNSFQSKVAEPCDGEAQIGDGAVGVVHGVVFCGHPSLLEEPELSVDPSFGQECDLRGASVSHEEERGDTKTKSGAHRAYSASK
jgi:hypothetical protein